MHLNIYLIEDDPNKCGWLGNFCGFLKGHLKNFAIDQKNTSDAKLDSAKIEFLKSALNDSEGLILLDLRLPGESRRSIADELLKLYKIPNEACSAIWKAFGGPNQDDTKLASAIVCIASRMHRRVLWISTQNEIKYYAGLPYVGDNWPLIFWPPNTMSAKNQTDCVKAEEEWRNCFSTIAEQITSMFEAEMRKDYHRAESSWKEIQSSLKTESFFGNDTKKMVGLFPDGRDEHHPSRHTDQSIVANLEKIDTLIKRANLKLNSSNKDKLYFLKGADRGAQIYVPVLAQILGSNDEFVLYSQKVVSTGSVSAGAFLYAIEIVLNKNNWRCEFIKIDNEKLCITFAFDCVTAADAARAVATLSMTPRQRMIVDNRPNRPGECVLALDYLKPDLVSAEDCKVQIQITKTLHPIL